MLLSNRLRDRSAFLSYLAASPIVRMHTYVPQVAVVVARASKAKRTLQVLAGSQVIVSDPKAIEDVVVARGEPVWVAGLGDTLDRPLVKRIEATGCPTLVWTID